MDTPRRKARSMPCLQEVWVEGKGDSMFYKTAREYLKTGTADAYAAADATYASYAKIDFCALADKAVEMAKTGDLK